MRGVLIVANKTLSDQQLLQRLAEYMAEEPCRFYVLVPTHPRHGRPWAVSTNGDTRAGAARRLYETLLFLHEMDADAAGEVSEQPPLQAIADVLRTEQFDEILLATLPPGAGGWSAQDLPRRVMSAFAVPVTHLSAPPTR
jgi:hypothetical protein